MQRWKSILFNTSFALNCLLVFLLIFERSMVVPPWVQTIGRLHPLVLHFPIVLIVLAICWELLGSTKNRSPEFDSTGDWLLLLTALTAVATALSGLLLSKEDGYTQEVLSWHKWGGVFISVLSAIWYAARYILRLMKPALVLTSVTAMIVVFITGHLGAGITHGENFLLAPVSKEKEAPADLFEDAAVYADLVHPILQSKCTGCHNAKKAKGELVMEPIKLLLKGGKNGVLWDPREPDLGLMLRRIHLPLENKKHMPPAGKPQLTDEEIAILYHWIRTGASFTAKLAALPETDSLRMIAAPLFNTIETDVSDFAPADEKRVAGLRNNYRLITPLSLGSPALSVEFFGAAQFNSGQLKELLDIREQIISLNLNKMPVTDEDLNTIARFQQLRRLNLSFTNIKGTGLSALRDLKQLKQLSLSGTGVTAANLSVLNQLPALTKLYIWSTPAQGADQVALQKQLKHATIESGFSGDTILIKLNPPLVENEAQILLEPTALQLKHYIKGVSIHYTTDGTDPDSIQSPLYRADFKIHKNTTIKARAFKTGWVGSDVTERIFYRAGYKVDTSYLLQSAPDAPYKTIPASILTDAHKGDLNYRSGKWLGFRGQSMQAMLQFNEPNEISSITISTLVNIDGYIMPPKQVEIWAGNAPGELRLIKKMNPEQPGKVAPAYMKGYELSFKNIKAKCFKVVLVPIAKLPAWHRGKGDRGWVFVDELFFN